MVVWPIKHHWMGGEHVCFECFQFGRLALEARGYGQNNNKHGWAIQKEHGTAAAPIGRLLFFVPNSGPENQNQKNNKTITLIALTTKICPNDEKTYTYGTGGECYFGAFDRYKHRGKQLEMTYSKVKNQSGKATKSYK